MIGSATLGGHDGRHEKGVSCIHMLDEIASATTNFPATRAAGIIKSPTGQDGWA